MPLGRLGSSELRGPSYFKLNPALISLLEARLLKKEEKEGKSRKKKEKTKERERGGGGVF